MEFIKQVDEDLHHIKANPFLFYFLYTDLDVHFYNNPTPQFL